MKNHQDRDVVFNEKVMYKDQLQGKKEENENMEYIMLDEIKENEFPKVPKNQQQQQIPQTPEKCKKIYQVMQAL